jgi:hypothetical protein
MAFFLLSAELSDTRGRIERKLVYTFCSLRFRRQVTAVHLSTLNFAAQTPAFLFFTADATFEFVDGDESAFEMKSERFLKAQCA